jgi:hypothetical protein
MRLKLLYLSTIVAVVILSACTEEIPVYGDKDLASELQIVNITDSVGGTVYSYECTPRDTTYEYFYLQPDTIFNSDGTVNKIEKDTVYYYGKTAKLYALPELVLPAYKNRLYIELQSNARWNAPQILFKSERETWISNANVAGIADAIIDYNIQPREYGFPAGITIPIRRKAVTQYVYTQDSTVMYEIRFSQKSMTEN